MTERDRRGAPRARVNWPVTVETVNGRVLLGEVVDMSASGARLTVRGDLQAGSAVTLKVTLPRASERLEVVARVTRRLGDDVGVDFVGLPESDARRLRSLLAASWESRRRAPRVRADLPVVIEETFGAIVPATIEDLSAFGARVVSERPLRPGGLVSLMLSGVDDGGLLRVRAVVWPGEGPGTVLVFVNLAEPEFQRLGGYVGRLLDRGGA